MLQLFRFNHPIANLILLVLAFLLRIPSFEPEFLGLEESLLLQTVMRMHAGHNLYSDVLSSVAPLLAGIWYVFYVVFEDFCLPAIRIFSSVYLFLCAFLFNQLINDLRLSRDKSLFPGILFLTGVCLPWYSQQMNGEMLMLLPLLLSVYLIIRTFEEGGKPLQLLLMVGLLTSLSVLLEYQSVIYYFGILIIYLIIRPPRLNEFFTLIIGFFLPVFFCALILGKEGILSGWVQNSLLYRLDVFINTELVFAPVVNAGHRYEMIFAILGACLPLIGGFVSFRVGILGLNIRQRKIESVMSIWLGVSLFILLVSGAFKYENPMMIIVFPMVFYIWRFFMGKMNPWLGTLLLLLLFSYPIGSLSQYYFIRNKETLASFPLESIPNRNVNLHHIIHPDAHLAATASVIRNIAAPKEPRVWICGNIPGLTPLTTLSQESGIVDYFLFVNKLSFLPENQNRTLYSSELFLLDVYKIILSENPEFIVDPHHKMEALHYFMPILMEPYELVWSGAIPVYRK